ncbi:indolepyruvate ferredoxin oxidoreductase subunit alpha [Candidatus Micrarchaeota archaeon RBG_16_36_9]|nr:MAG: indolepyruvate ferredoxin oxidoreductase subunit alpha [Candidatus Micrarchaeota archaeon RBG_16_36_9]
MQKVLINEPGKKVLLLGNEAIVRGALESGIGLASTYPGTPSSEIGETYANIAKDAGIYFEYSTNEKVALEVAAGAALSGVRSMCFFKHFGLNVACDSLFPLAYSKIKAGMVVIVADDPQGWSSGQSEEDTRLFSKIAHLPMLEPSNSQECKDFVKKAFELSEKFQLPVLIRTTTRVSHMRSIVKLGEIIKGKTKGKFVKDIAFRNFPPHVIETHKEMHNKLDKLEQISEKSNFNFIVNNKKSNIGIIVSGVSFDYIMDAMDDLKLELPVLRIGFTNPLPDDLIKGFIKKFKKILVIEELESFIEDHVKMLAKESNPKLKIFGKGYFSPAGEYSEEIVLNVLSQVTGKKYGFDLAAHKKKYLKIQEPRRLPVLCPGCPHRATFYAAKVATRDMDVVYAGDVGCYVLGIFRPFETQDFIFSMGASEGVGHGIRKATDQKVICFFGDSTFFHAGMTGMVNTVYNKSNPLIIIMDNRITAMTGHQPNPGMGLTAMGEQTKEISIEGVVKAFGVEDVRVIDPYNVNLMISSIRELLEKDKVSVIIAKRECQLLAARKNSKEGIKTAKFEIDSQVCKKCGTCLRHLACPAIHDDNGIFSIDKNICAGCGVCAQICPNKAIHAVKE